MTSEATSHQASGRAFERKVQRAAWALVFEQLWLRLWIILVLGGLYFLLSLISVWPLVGQFVHGLAAGLFGLGVLAALFRAGRINWPTRDEAIRRIESVSGVPHRPASSYEDTLSASTHDAATLALWKAHRGRMAQLLSRLKSGKPRPRTDRYDPFALRAMLVLFLVAMTGLLGEGAWERMRSAFHFGSPDAMANTRLDAWVAPPAYTGKPPVMLADGATDAAASAAAKAGGDKAASVTPEVPEKSILIVRASGSGLERLGLEISAEGAEPVRLEADPKKSASDVSELRHELKRSATLRVMNGKIEIARWPIDVIADKPPKIWLNRRPELTPRGSMKLSHSVEDDYGVASAVAKLDRAKPAPGDPAKAWAQTDPLRGPRWPLSRPPPFKLTLPHGAAKDSAQYTFLEFNSHPWAGRKVIMTLEAKDVAGQIGRSEPFEMILPEKHFNKPLARAVIEQRKKLLEDHRTRSQVRTALAAITHEPEGFIDDMRVYLGLRTAYYRLTSDRTRAGMKSVTDQLWQIAQRIEDGDLSDAERRFKEAQDRLAKALRDGASDEEIKKLMQELREAMGDFMQQLAKKNESEQDPDADGQDPNNQSLRQQDMERMMKELEDTAKNGSREQAQQLLSEMQDLMERVQTGKQTEAQAKQSKEMMESIKELSDTASEQQRLMDDTFDEQKNQNGQDGSHGKPNMKGSPGGEDGKKSQGGSPGNKGQQKAQRGRGQPGGRQGQGMPDANSQGGDGAGQEPSPNERQLGERQKGLKDRLGRLQRDLRAKGHGSPEQLDAARRAMENAERGLAESDLEGAAEQQGQALEKMRQSAQSMAQDMLSKIPGRQGQNADTPRDPLGRPQRSQGPDNGTSVKVPDKIDQQRAREILEELRRRVGEASRPPVEIDYLERLLKRF